MAKDGGCEVLDDVVCSSNARALQRGQPDDRGVAVYFTVDDQPTVLACDRWNRLEHNLWAIAKDIEATRARLRWGVTTVRQAFHGQRYLELAAGTDWRRVLQLAAGAGRAEVEAAFKRLAKSKHPDQGGSHEAFVELEAARQAALRELAGGAATGAGARGGAR